VSRNRRLAGQHPHRLILRILIEYSPARRGSQGPGLDGAWRERVPAGRAAARSCAPALEAGPAVHGRDQDQRRTLARASALAMRLFSVSYTVGATRCGALPGATDGRRVSRTVLDADPSYAPVMREGSPDRS
jgi:hypothetical protein